MLKSISEVFRKSVEALLSELHTREPEDQVAELLTAMRKEMVAARAAIPDYEQDVVTAREAVAAERAEIERCERRAAMADRIGDEETASIAREYADRHRERLGVLERKGEAAEAELLLRRREVEEMTRQYRNADANRFGLVAQLRMRGRRASGGDDPFDDFARMEERIDSEAATAEARRELDEEEPPPPPRSSIDDRLAELKRRMNQQ